MGRSRPEIRRRHFLWASVALHRRGEARLVGGGAALDRSSDGHLGLEVLLRVEEGVLHDRRVGAGGGHGRLELSQVCLYVTSHDAPPRRRQ